jgi:2-haloalkanoic acid dehalogenase type II
MNIQAVIFDRDNTLVRFDEDAVALLEARVAAVATAIPLGAAAAHWEAWPGPWPRSEAEEPRFWRAFWSSLAARYQLPAATVAALLEIGAFYHSCFVAYPDTAACLRSLRERGLRLAVLTNFELPSIGPTLQRAGLDPRWFTALLSSAILGVYKPDPRAYLAAAAALGLPPNACAFVDDLPANVRAANAVGMRGVLIERQGLPMPGAIERIEDLSSLADLLTTLG